ncbi:MAG: heat-inducible transcriptional repressor HrcA [Eubacteriales bacterium]
MELNDRKIKVLQAIILSYLESAEPVGSRTLSKQYDFGISSATIRNEMSDLEELGLIKQPHTSAGRIPSDTGYRLYVDQLMKHKEIQEDLLKEVLFERVDRLEALLQDIAKILANHTKYATVVTTPQYKQTKIKHIQLLSLDFNNILIVIVVEGNIVKNHLLNLKVPIKLEMLRTINLLLNNNLHGLTVQDINLDLIQNLKNHVGIHREIINGVLDAVMNTVKSVDDIEIYTSGATNILRFPEFSDIDKATELLCTLEEKNIILSMINETINKQNDDVKIVIGNENNIKSFEDCSFITTTYHIGKDTIGAVGIIGPKRMDYVKVVSMLKYMIKQMDNIWNKKSP